ncbi:hypothetical protein LIER_02757 [Lithospermum erythrorhizon]|uniref:U-box domain-containing protein n=1 Tax=Lithospermum erythrorhizon TaxID=34254 RepID=A0AAV3NS27_LITER
MDEFEVPSYFLCPISLEIMKDPVTVTTGITYDRESIEKWIFQGKNNCCPVTKQILNQDLEITPNITLRRLIQAWCTLNASTGIERFPTPKPPASKIQILKLINEARNGPQKEVKCLQSLRSVASISETNKRCIESAGGVEFLVCMINKGNEREDVKPCEEALSLLYNLKLSENGLRFLFKGNNEFVGSLIRAMQRGSYESRAYAVMLLKSMFEVADNTQMVNLKMDFFVELVEILNDQISNKASKATLKLLVDVCPWGRNKIKAVEAGLVSLLIDLILDCNYSNEKRVCEMMFVLLEQLCKCAEGRAELLKHGAGLAMVSKKIFRVSHVVSEMAVKILYSISKFLPTNVVLQEMLNLGVVGKLCLVLQVDCDVRMKEKAREILKLHSRAWKNSPCIPMNFYPC